MRARQGRIVSLSYRCLFWMCARVARSPAQRRQRRVSHRVLNSTHRRLRNRQMQREVRSHDFLPRSS